MKSLAGARNVAAGLFVVSLLFSPVIAIASQQAVEGSGGFVRVTVIDPQGLALPGATATLTPSPPGVAISQASDAEGVVLFSDVRPGIYTLRVDLDGFLPTDRDDIVVTSGATRDVPVTLPIARIATNVVVAAPGPKDVGVGSGATVAAGVVERTLLQRLPLAVQSIKDALPLVPGIVRSTTGEVTFKGATEQHSGLYVNGMNAADPATGDPPPR